MKWKSSLIKFFVLSLALALSACASKEEADPPAKSAFAVIVNVTQVDGTGSVLKITLANGTNRDTREITTDGRYSFTTLLANSAGFRLDIEDPDDKVCKFVGNADIHTTGVIDKDDIEFSVSCTDVPNYSLAGTTTNLNSTLVTLRTIITRNNTTRSDVNIDISDNGAFTLATHLRERDDYSVTIIAQQGSDTCSISNGSGTAAAANISDIAITCTPNTAPVFNIGGTPSNIDPNTQPPGVNLKINGGNDLFLTNNDPFTFGTPVPNGTYTVTLEDPTSPTQFCNFANGTKSTAITISGADNLSLVLNCVTQTFAIGGSITGLASNSLVITNNNNSEQATLAGNPPDRFAFATDVMDGSYTLSIQDPSNPAQRCRFGNDRRSRSVNVTGGDVSNANINCVTRQYNVLADVDVTNLTGTLGLELVVPNNPIVSLGISNSSVSPVSFGVSYDDLSTYTVNIVSQPVGETCTFPGGLLSDSDALSGSDATTRTISCTALPTFSITGQVDGLIVTDSISLQINPTNDTAQASGNTPDYTFNNLLVGDYTISITPPPADYDCIFPGGATTTTLTVGASVPAPLITCRQKLTALSIADTNLSNCLTIEIAGPPVKTYVDEITTLSCAGAGVVDLTGMDKLFNLATLNLPDNSIVDVSALTGLNILSVLDLSNNLLTDTALPTLESLAALTSLNLGNDVSLVNQNSLTRIPNIVGLTSLNLNNNTPATPVLDLTNLGASSGLLELRVDGNGLADLTSFAGVTQITTLSISGNALTDVTGLAGITDLQTLSLMDNTVAMTNLSSLALGGLPNITSINLTGNAATPCANIEDLKTALGANQGIVISQSPVAGADCEGPPPATDFLVSGDIINSTGVGLTTNSAGLELQLNGGNNLIIDGAATTFAFTTPIPAGDYTVTVLTQPTDPVEDIICTVDPVSGSGTSTTDVINVTVDCNTNPEVAVVAALNTAQGITGDIFNQCLIVQSPLLRVNEVGTANTLTNPIGLTESRTVDCSSSSITDLSGIQYLDAVTELNISNNLLDDAGLEALTNMKQLITLDASNIQVSVLPSAMNNLSNLLSLNLASNQITDVSSLEQLTTLNSLELQSNTIGGLNVGRVDLLVSLTNATNIDLTNNNTTMSCTEFQTLLVGLANSENVVKPAITNPSNVDSYQDTDCVNDFAD